MSESGLESPVLEEGKPPRRRWPWLWRKTPSKADYPETSSEVWKVYRRCLQEVEYWTNKKYPKIMENLELETSVERELFLSGLTRFALQNWSAKPTRLFALRPLVILESDAPQDPEKIKKVEEELLSRVSISENEAWGNYCLSLDKDPNDPLAQKYLGTIKSAAHLVHAAITTKDPKKVDEYCENWASKIAAARNNFLKPSP